jgi:hypothetical protein
MKMNLKLTADELMNVVDAAMDEAIDRGYDPDDEETVEDMLHIVDAALSAMGIEITEDVDVDAEDEDEDEDEDFDPIDEMVYVLDDGRGAISFADACYLMDSIREVLQKNGMDTADAPEIFMNICREHDIEVVDNSIDNEDEDEDEEETESNPIDELLVERDGKKFLKETDAKLLLDFLRELVNDKFSELPDAVRESILCKMWCKFGEDFGIEGVLRGE